MIKPPIGAILLAVALPFSTAPLLEASDDPIDDKVIVLSDDDTELGDIQIDDSKPFVVHLGQEHGRGYLGVSLVEITPALREHFGVASDAGVMVGGVEADSPAAKAGVQVGDILTGIDGNRIESVSELSRAVRRKKAGETITLDLSRDRAKKQLKVAVAERKPKEIHVSGLGPKVRKYAWAFSDDSEKSLERLQERLDEMEKKLKDLEKKMPSR
jgi:membrane-associated protease RseP (regulator of RpoE activity)